MDDPNDTTEHDVKQFTEHAAIHENSMDIVSRKLSSNNTLNPIPTLKL